jgi:hypothetical protein
MKYRNAMITIQLICLVFTTITRPLAANIGNDYSEILRDNGASAVIFNSAHINLLVERLIYQRRPGEDYTQAVL